MNSSFPFSVPLTNELLPKMRRKIVVVNRGFAGVAALARPFAFAAVEKGRLETHAAALSFSDV